MNERKRTVKKLNYYLYLSKDKMPTHLSMWTKWSGNKKDYTDIINWDNKQVYCTLPVPYEKLA